MPQETKRHNRTKDPKATQTANASPPPSLPRPLLFRVVEEKTRLPYYADRADDRSSMVARRKVGQPSDRERRGVEGHGTVAPHGPQLRHGSRRAATRGPSVARFLQRPIRRNVARRQDEASEATRNPRQRRKPLNRVTSIVRSARAPRLSNLRPIDTRKDTRTNAYRRHDPPMSVCDPIETGPDIQPPHPIKKPSAEPHLRERQDGAAERHSAENSLLRPSSNRDRRRRSIGTALPAHHHSHQFPP